MLILVVPVSLAAVVSPTGRLDAFGIYCDPHVLTMPVRPQICAHDAPAIEQPVHHRIAQRTDGHRMRNVAEEKLAIVSLIVLPRIDFTEDTLRFLFP